MHNDRAHYLHYVPVDMRYRGIHEHKQTLTSMYETFSIRYPISQLILRINVTSKVAKSIIYLLTSL